MLFVVVFLSGAMVSCLKEVFRFLCFVVDFRKVPTHFLSFNTDETISTVLIKNGYLLYFNRVCLIVWVVSVASVRRLVCGVGQILAWVEILAWVAWVKNPHR